MNSVNWLYVYYGKANLNNMSMAEPGKQQPVVQKWPIKILFSHIGIVRYH